MTITHDFDTKDELSDLWRIRSELNSTLNRIDELIAQKEWESSKKS